MEQNKTGKYFKYAIGEIVLVVIGILIALSINNWNEKKKSDAFETKLLQELAISLEKDLERAEWLLNGRALSKSKAIDDLLDDLMNNSVVEDSILIRNFFSAGLTLSFSYDKGPYESLKSVGLDKISNDSLRSKIVRFNEVTMPLAIIFVDYKMDIHNNRREMFRERIFEKYYAKEDGKWVIKNRTNFTETKSSKAFMELIYMERRVANNYIDRLERIVIQLQEMLQSIKQELSSRK